MMNLAITLLLTLSTTALAAPMSALTSPQAQYGAGGGILGFIVLVLDIIVWIEVLKSSRPPLHKILWALAVFFFPIIGVVVYWLFSDRKKWNDSGYEVLP